MTWWISRDYGLPEKTVVKLCKVKLAGTRLSITVVEYILPWSEWAESTYQAIENFPSRTFVWSLKPTGGFRMISLS